MIPISLFNKSKSFSISDFSLVSSQLQFNQNQPNTISIIGGALQLTPLEGDRAATVWLTQKVRITSFKTHFSFRILDSVNTGADGIAFILQNVGLNAIGSPGGQMAYRWASNPLAPASLGVAIFFKTWQSEEIIILVGDTVISTTASPFTFKGNSNTTHCWVEYSNQGNVLNIFLSQTSTKPSNPTVSQVTNIFSTLGPTAYVGFGSGTGGAQSRHQIITWYWY